MASHSGSPGNRSPGLQSTISVTRLPDVTWPPAPLPGPHTVLKRWLSGSLPGQGPPPAPPPPFVSKPDSLPHWRVSAPHEQCPRPRTPPGSVLRGQSRERGMAWAWGTRDPLPSRGWAGAVGPGDAVSCSVPAAGLPPCPHPGITPRLVWLGPDLPLPPRSLLWTHSGRKLSPSPTCTPDQLSWPPDGDNYTQHPGQGPALQGPPLGPGAGLQSRVHIIGLVS